VSGRDKTLRRKQDRRSRVRHRPKARRPPPRERKLVYEHPWYGPIPLIEVTTSGADGKLSRHHTWDLSYQPELPPGAIRGDPRAQEFCGMCQEPKYLYLDEPRRCLQCGNAFTFWAREQKFWYETLKFNFASTAVRCVTCRRRRKTQRLALAEIEAARAAVVTTPNDAATQLELARTLVQLHVLTGAGDLNDAIAAARKARRLGHDVPEWRTSYTETWFWEGNAQRRAGRNVQAVAALSRFLRDAPRRGRYAKQVREAEAWLKTEHAV
jgi:hypothetical protein